VLHREFWCPQSRSWVCSYVKWEGDCLCIIVAEETWEKLSHAWSRACYNCLCIKEMEALSLWWALWYLHRSYKSKVHLHLKGLKFKAEVMAWIDKELWSYYSLYYWQSKCSGWCIKTQVDVTHVELPSCRVWTDVYFLLLSESSLCPGTGSGCLLEGGE
jgi:hypothetical protein